MENKGDESVGPPLKSEPGHGASETAISISQRKSGIKGKLKSTVIDHTYYDYSTRNVAELHEAAERNLAREGHDTDGKRKQSTSIKDSKRVTFPMKLHKILSNPAYRHIIRWLPHGRCWNIYDKDLLESVVCKEHFSHEKFDSFNRSVNMWGFKRLLRDDGSRDFKAYYHEKFLRGRPELAKLMKRLVNPGKRIPDPRGEPDFYEIAKRFPLPPDPNVAEDEAVNVEVHGLSSRPSGEEKISQPVKKVVPQFSRQSTSMPVHQYVQSPRPNPNYGLPYKSAHQQRLSAAFQSPYPAQAPAASLDNCPNQLRLHASNPSLMSASYPPANPRFDPHLHPNEESYYKENPSNWFRPPVPNFQCPYHSYTHSQYYPPRQDFANASYGNPAPQFEKYRCQAPASYITKSSSVRGMTSSCNELHSASQLEACRRQADRYTEKRPDHAITQKVQHLPFNEPNFAPYLTVASAASSYAETTMCQQMLQATFKDAVQEGTGITLYEDDERKPSATSPNYMSADQHPAAGLALSKSLGAYGASNTNRSESVKMWSKFSAAECQANNARGDQGLLEVHEELHKVEGSVDGALDDVNRRYRSESIELWSKFWAAEDQATNNACVDQGVLEVHEEVHKVQGFAEGSSWHDANHR